ncbi:ABC transporter ATP-binding protein [Paraburkholderia sp. 22B1P]|uniref:ABC transporter ATP-binding protein n=1 Tax=Paraburkholderia sp. 22B1P TaxID=3080498 RepID=UPI003089B8AB|nr:ABC transporter ATP-binding protein [Paraburkholderia sp. 22B1P]
MTNILLSVEGLRVSYGTGRAATEVLHGLDFTVSAGEAVGLVGESGSGKSVASLAVLGLLGSGGHVSGGRIMFEGEDLARAKESRMRALRGRRVSMIFQDPATALNPAFTIGSQLADVIRAHRSLRGGALGDEIESVLQRVGFREPRRAAKSYPHELSGGMKQRAMIAAAIVCEPSLLIADEPTTALDVTVQAQIVGLLRKLVDELHIGLVFITHNLDLMAELCTRAVVLKQGNVVEHGDVESIFLRPSHPYTQQLIDSIPRLPNVSARSTESGRGANHVK